MMKSVTAMISMLVASAALGLGSCQAQGQFQPSRDAAGYEDLRGSPLVKFEGQLWLGPSGIGAVFDPTEHDGIRIVEGAFSTSMFGLTWHDEPVAAITNTFEIDKPNI